MYANDKICLRALCTEKLRKSAFESFEAADSVALSAALSAAIMVTIIKLIIIKCRKPVTSFVSTLVPKLSFVL